MEQEKFYPKTKELLNSMALRSDHGFGIYDEEDQKQIIKEMDELYDAYVAGESNKEISGRFNISIITVAQVREEMNGKGFFQPNPTN